MDDNVIDLDAKRNERLLMEDDARRALVSLWEDSRHQYLDGITLDIDVAVAAIMDGEIEPVDAYDVETGDLTEAMSLARGVLVQDGPWWSDFDTGE